MEEVGEGEKKKLKGLLFSLKNPRSCAWVWWRKKNGGRRGEGKKRECVERARKGVLMEVKGRRRKKKRRRGRKGGGGGG